MATPDEYSPYGKNGGRTVGLDFDVDVKDCVILETPPRTHDMGSSGMTSRRALGRADSSADSPPPVAPPRQPRPYVCAFIILLCCIVFIVEVAKNGWGFQPFVCPASCGGQPCYEDGSVCQSNPMLGPTVEVMRQMGAKDDVGIFERGEWWRIFTCNWLHVGLFHLLFNMLAVLSLGIGLERRFGSARLGALYVLSGLFGTMVSVVLLPGVLSLGASASVFGLVGATWADVILNYLARGTIRNSGFCSLLFLTIINLLVGLTPYVDNFMHIGGLLSGLIVGLVLFTKKHLNPRTRKLTYTRSQKSLVVAGAVGFVLITAGCIAIGASSDVRETLRQCEFCANMNCVEVSLFTGSPWWSCCLSTSGGGAGTCSIEVNRTYLSAICNLTETPIFLVPCPRSEPSCNIDRRDQAAVSAICQRLCSGCRA